MELDNQFRGYGTNGLLLKLITAQINSRDYYKACFVLTNLLMEEHDKKDLAKIAEMVWSNDKDCQYLGMSLLFSNHLTTFNYCLEYHPRLLESVNFHFRFNMFVGSREWSRNDKWKR